MTPDRPAAPVTDAYVIAMRNAFAEVCADAKAELPDCNREVIDKIADTLDLIPASAVPDFIGLDGTTNGAVSALIGKISVRSPVCPLWHGKA